MHPYLLPTEPQAGPNFRRRNGVKWCEVDGRARQVAAAGRVKLGGRQR